jgi:1,4-alpha-glucan branching enzyme
MLQTPLMTASSTKTDRPTTTKVRVQFVYLTGLKRDIFQNVRLKGSWDGDGRYSDDWSTTPMEPIVGEDGCPAFRATVEFDPAQVDWNFHWGVIVDAPSGKDQWGITTEINDQNSTERYRTLTLWAPTGGRPQEERYYLIHSRWLGAQKHRRPGADRDGIRFAVWAPNAQNVEVVIGTMWNANDPTRRPTEESLPVGQIAGGYIADNGAGSHPRLGPFPMTRLDNGVWITDEDDPRLADFTHFDHKPYMFRVTKDNGRVAYRTDLYSRCQVGSGRDNPRGAPFFGLVRSLEGSVSCSAVVNPDSVTKYFKDPDSVWPEREFIPAEQFWTDENDRIGGAGPVARRVQDLVIYELHVGALGFGKPGPGTLEDAINLLDYLVDLGVTAIELLPMSQFSGEENWGYATSHYFAIEYSGGGRDQYKYFIKECHRRGIAVILDVVYNHFTPDGERAEWMYDTDDHARNSYYWYEGHPSDYPGFDTGGYSDNMSTGYAPRYYDEMVRKMFISSAVSLVEEFHVDGFRADQTTSIHSYNVLHKDGRLLGNANAFGAKLLREWSRTLRMIRPDVMLMAEDHSHWDKVTQPTEVGGLGFDAPWYADFYHHLIGDTDKGSDYAKLIKTAGFGDDRPLAMSSFAGALGATSPHTVVYNESHDEAGNGYLTKRTILVAINEAPLVGETRRFAEARCRFAFGCTVLSAGVPMFLFGEEVGFKNDFLYNHILALREDFRTLRQTTGQHLFTFYSDLIHLRRDNPGLQAAGIDVLHVHDANRVLAWHRWGDGQNFLILSSLNNRAFRDGYVVANPRLPDGRWKEIFNSDSARFGGDGIGNSGAEIPSHDGVLNAVIPANGFIVLKRV